MGLSVVVGAQYGSEGKGNLVAHLANEYQHHVRVGGPNAGHSFKLDGIICKMQQVPCGWINRHAMLYIGAGGMVSLPVLRRELNLTAGAGRPARDRLIIDPQAAVLSEKHHAAEGGVHGELHQRIGSTGEGIGAVRAARMSRDVSQVMLARSEPELDAYVPDVPVSAQLNGALRSGENVLIEGTQGAALSLIHGPWPYVTTADTNAAQMLADVGLSPTWSPEVILVARTFPIRVAGNSGPMRDELSWEEMANETGIEGLVERTTVTNKVRRVGRWDDELFRQGAILNKPTAVCLNFVDYLNKDDAGQTEFNKLSLKSRDFIDQVEVLANAPVYWIGTGGPDWAIIDRRFR